MSPQGWLQIALFLAVLLALVPPLGAYLARVYPTSLMTSRTTFWKST